MAPIVHTYRSGESGLFVNSYLVEGTGGVVAIDPPLLLSDGRAFRALLEALRKPLLGVLVTHPHPDHYNTIGELLAGEEKPVIAQGDVDREIRAKDDAKRAQWGTDVRRRVAGQRDVPKLDGGGRRIGPTRRPAVYRLGRRTLRKRERNVWLLGDGDIAFAGDLAFNGTHAYLADGHTDAWLDAIDSGEEALAGVRTLYVGHGAPTGPAVLADQRRYLLMAREAIGRAAGRAQLSEEGGESRGEPDGALPARRATQLAGRRRRLGGRRRARAGGRNRVIARAGATAA